jgi:hypothetical protein
MNKFEDLNGRFASLGTGMTQQRKFRDRWCTTLLNITSLFTLWVESQKKSALRISTLLLIQSPLQSL